MSQLQQPRPIAVPIMARRYVFSGHVQGVGFRPFVYRLAQQHGIHGWVQNTMGQVVIHAEASEQALQAFAKQLVAQAPAASTPRLVQVEDSRVDGSQAFLIKHSNANSQHDIHIVPDLSLCDACRQELFDPANPRYRYPFINCTHCGPRYSVIRQLPYDRVNTSMADFHLCEACDREYHDPHNRRFHAEPLACAHCGPSLSYKDNSRYSHDTQQALTHCVTALRAGKIIAVKGIAGYHLMCDAANVAAVSELRRRKQRPHKPLAVMLPEQQLRDYIHCDAETIRLLKSPTRPIVPVKPAGSRLADNIAPGLREIGVMLAYSPLHELLLAGFAGPLVATSANISGEPVLIDNHEVEQRLAGIVDGFLHHDRKIQRPADDPLYRLINKQPMPVRLGRGNAPLELELPFRLERPVLATGGHMKNTVALAWDSRIVVSAHIGDLATQRSQQVYSQVITDLQQLYHVQAEQVICDAHPGYASSRWARDRDLPLVQVSHHHAHAAVVCGEYPQESRWLVFTWDGTGLGPDQTLWGGEALLGHAGNWQRVASLQPFVLPGGDKASRQPWRSAASLCWQNNIDWQAPVAGWSLLRQAWQKKLNCPATTAVGRLFDAAAALLGLVDNASYEGQAPMLLEALAADTSADAIAMPLHTGADKVLRSDWAVLLPMLLDKHLPMSERAACFHESLALALLEQAKQLRQQHGDFCVGLSGGVFQNRRLTERVAQLLTQAGFRHAMPVAVPVNDAGLAYGQVIEAMMHAGRSAA